MNGEDGVTIETPEHVVFDYALAGMASRIVAALIDLALVIVSMLIVLLCLLVAGAAGLGMWAMALLILSGFLAFWGYPILCELFMGGRTVGKRVMGLRVIRDGGYALTPSAILVRNLVRVVDFLPGGFLLGLLVMMFNRKYKRIGDFAAGTIVICDRVSPAPRRLTAAHLAGAAQEDALMDLRRAGVHRLAPGMVRLIEDYLVRRRTLDSLSRRRIASRIARAAGAQLQVAEQQEERFLERVLLARLQHEERAAARGGEAAFVRQNHADWKRLEKEAARLEGMSAQRILSFVGLYRKVSGDLARARMLDLGPGRVDSLNDLVGRIHLRVYEAPAFAWRKAAEFYRSTFPRTVRRLWRYVLASAALLLVPAVASYAAVAVNPHLSTAFAPPGYVDNIDESFGESFGSEERAAGTGALMTSFYISNNVQVSFLSFALGMFLGLGSAFVLVQNGMLLGGVAAIIAGRGLSYNFWSFVSSHGGIELGAIVLSGAAGMRVGLSLANPGMLTRRAALAAAARDAGLVMFGVITLLVIAALIEAFVSPSPLPNPLKLSLGAVNLLAFVGYLTLAGRGVLRDESKGTLRQT